MREGGGFAYGGSLAPSSTEPILVVAIFPPRMSLRRMLHVSKPILKSQWTAENIWPSLERKYRENVIHCTQGLSVGYLFNEKQLTYPG